MRRGAPAQQAKLSAGALPLARPSRRALCLLIHRAPQAAATRPAIHPGVRPTCRRHSAGCLGVESPALFTGRCFASLSPGKVQPALCIVPRAGFYPLTHPWIEVAALPNTGLAVVARWLIPQSERQHVFNTVSTAGYKYILIG